MGQPPPETSLLLENALGGAAHPVKGVHHLLGGLLHVDDDVVDPGDEEVVRDAHRDGDDEVEQVGDDGEVHGVFTLAGVSSVIEVSVNNEN